MFIIVIRDVMKKKQQEAQQMLRQRDIRAVGREFDRFRTRFWALSLVVGVQQV